MEKKKYEKPEMEAIELEGDVITTSGDDCIAQHSSANYNVSC